MFNDNKIFFNNEYTTINTKIYEVIKKILRRKIYI